jgi:hypothetical protein
MTLSHHAVGIKADSLSIFRSRKAMFCPPPRSAPPSSPVIPWGPLGLCPPKINLNTLQSSNPAVAEIRLLVGGSSCFSETGVCYPTNHSSIPFRSTLPKRKVVMKPSRPA